MDLTKTVPSAAVNTTIRKTVCSTLTLRRTSGTGTVHVESFTMTHATAISALLRKRKKIRTCKVVKIATKTSSVTPLAVKAIAISTTH